MGTVDNGVRFAWTEDMVGRRVVYYPPEEGNRVRPHDEHYWSAVEMLPRERLQEIQLRKLQQLATHVEASSALYARLWGESGVTASDIRSLDDLRRFPVMTKTHFERDQHEHPPYGTALTSPAASQMKFWQTSGTTGAPRLWAENKEDWENGMYMYARAFYAHGIRPGWRAYFAFSYPPFIAFWLAHYAAEMMGCQTVPKGPLPTQAWLGLVGRLAGTAPAFMCATPTYAQRQIEVAQEMRLHLPDLRVDVLSLAGEPGACVPATKRLIESAWGATAHDVLGSTETSGPIFFTCVQQAKLEAPSDHANVDYFILEVLDPDTHEVVSDGAAGSLCVTALGRTGIPAVRFLLNDYVRLSWEQCGCGRSLPLVHGGISARSDDMLVIKGVNVYPSLLENLIRGRPGLAHEYVLVREALDARLRVEALPDLDRGQYDALGQRIQADIRTATTLTLPVEVLPPGSLPRSETKSKRIQAV
jgi:phenylacetate-CoA ligase